MIFFSLILFCYEKFGSFSKKTLSHFLTLALSLSLSHFLSLTLTTIVKNQWNLLIISIARVLKLISWGSLFADLEVWNDQNDFLKLDRMMQRDYGFTKAY